MVDIKDFSSLVDLYYAKVFYHCVKTIKNNHDSSDITQNTFTKAFINIKNLKQIDSFGAWIFTICNNEIKLFYRNRQKNIPDSLDNLNVANIADKSINVKKYDNLYSAIDILEEKYQNLIILKYFAEFSVKEIAVLTDIDEKLVKSRLYDARKKLETLLSDSDFHYRNINNFNKERKKEIMSTVKLLELGSQVIPCMSVWGQKNLLKCAENNEKFSNEVLSELAKIEKGNEFTVECGGKLSYDEFIKVLAGCQEDLIHRIGDSWLNGKDSKLLRDTDNYRRTGGYIKTVDFIMMVPSILDTVNWYKKYLSWRCEDEPQSIDEYGHAIISTFDDYGNKARSFGGFHLRKGTDANPGKSFTCFVFVTGIESLRKKIQNAGWEKVSDIYKQGWGVKQFTVEDLNGFVLEFSEWDCE